MATKIMYTDNIHVSGEMFDSDGDPGSAGKALIATSTGSTWQDVPAGTPILLTTAILNGTAVTTSNTFAAVNCIGSQILTSGDTWTSSSSAITIPDTGYYQISLAITTTSTAQRATDVFTIGVNSTATGADSSNAYIRNGSNAINEAACVLTQTLQLVNGDNVTLMSKREGNITTAGTTVGSKSVISIRRLGQPSTTTGVISSAESSEATRNIIIGTSSTPPAISGVFANTIYFQREA